MKHKPLELICLNIFTIVSLEQKLRVQQQAPYNTHYLGIVNLIVVMNMNN